MVNTTPSHDVNLEYYGSYSPGRDDYWRKMAAPRLRVRTILRLLAERRPERMCDLGCGNGVLLREIADRFPTARLAGIDLSETQTLLNRSRFPGAQWYAADLGVEGALPAELLGSQDTLTASEIIEHVADPLQFLRNALALAVPGRGRLLLSTQSGPVRETERRVGHLRHFTTAEMESLLRSGGWKPIRVWNCGFPFHDLSKWWANRDPEATMQRFSGASYGTYENLICRALRFAFLFNSRSRGAQLFAVAERPGG